MPLVDARGLVFVAGPERVTELEAWVRGAPPEIRIERIDLDALAALAPAFRGRVAAAWSFPEEGRIDIGSLVAGFTRGARQQGVGLRRSSRVAGLLSERGRVTGVRLAGGGAIGLTLFYNPLGWFLLLLLIPGIASIIVGAAIVGVGDG